MKKLIKIGTPKGLKSPIYIVEDSDLIPLEHLCKALGETERSEHPTAFQANFVEVATESDNPKYDLCIPFGFVSGWFCDIKMKKLTALINHLSTHFANVQEFHKKKTEAIHSASLEYSLAVDEYYCTKAIMEKEEKKFTELMEISFEDWKQEKDMGVNIM